MNFGKAFFDQLMDGFTFDLTGLSDEEVNKKILLAREL